ncbi:MAG TPA: argininosuccinate lyase [Pyrinomonadaceae bacterium]|nr:argininosuccinate lyase [Pyrinomonadaceae bacterium]
MAESKNLWGGRFSGAADQTFAGFNRSFSFDRLLLDCDVRASIAHCHGLANAKVITAQEAGAIEAGLQQVLELASSNSDLSNASAEDVHSFVEGQLVGLIGDTGGKLHTGRSRNDQVATDLRLWLRDAIDDLVARVSLTQTALLDFAEANQNAVLPGYTHLQRAQPILFAHWCLAYFEMLNRDRNRLWDARARVNVLPLGSAALAGTSYAIDREAVARELGFDSVSRNSLDAVSDRDFCVEFVSACSVVMVHLSRLAEDVILYATSEFGFFELADAVATGSSLMPQKKNPDSMELVRGKAARVFGHNVSLLTLLKGLPLAYNKDMQEDKEAVFDSFDTTANCLAVTSLVLGNIELKEARMEEAASRGYMNATELADYLVRKGMPFREAHDAVGRIVMWAIERGVEIQELSLDELSLAVPLIDGTVFDSLSLEHTLGTKSQAGGTAPERVREALAAARANLIG